MNIESSNLKKTTELQTQDSKSSSKNNGNSSVKFADELKEVAKNEAEKEKIQQEENIKSNSSDKTIEKVEEKSEKINQEPTTIVTESLENDHQEQFSKITTLSNKTSTEQLSENRNILMNNSLKKLEEERIPLENILYEQTSKDKKTQEQQINKKQPLLNGFQEGIQENKKPLEQQIKDKPILLNNFQEQILKEEKPLKGNTLANVRQDVPLKDDQQEKMNLKNELPNLSSAMEDMNSVLKEFNQSEDKTLNFIKKEENLTDKNDMINNDFNIQENKEILPQMSPNMSFSGDGQPFSSFMNNENEEKKSNNILGSSAQDLAEEAAILSTMAENIAIANKNQILSEKNPQKPSADKIGKSPIETKIAEKTPVQNIFEKPTKIVMDEEGIKEVDVKTGIKTETIVKYDTIIMNQADVEIFTNLVEKGEINLNELTPKTAEKAVNVSKTLADMLAKSMENNQPLRINFDNDISVIIRISRDGKITADFLPSSQVAEAYLKENLPLLKQRFEDNNIEYDSLNQRERREQQKDNNKKKDRNNE